MNLENLRTKLIAAARHDAPADDVPYAFEKRIQARIRNQPIEDIWSLWANGLWKGAAACAAISAISIVLSLWALPALADDPPAAPFETVVLAGADELTESW
jgi:hypothetical protein